MLNHVAVMGRLTHDPELKMTSNGVPVTTFRIAVDRDFKDKDGNRACDFLPVVAWRGTAEFVSRNFSKGRQAVVTGRIQVREFTKDGEKRSVTEIIADSVYFADSKQEKKEDAFYPADEEEIPF